jgi:hypothetical protein
MTSRVRFLKPPRPDVLKLQFFALELEPLVGADPQLRVDGFVGIRAQPDIVVLKELKKVFTC